MDLIEILNSVDSGVSSPEFDNPNIFNVGVENANFEVIDNLNLNNFELVERNI